MNATRTKTRLICPLTASSVQAMRVEMQEAARLGADAVECRLDYLAAAPTECDLAALLTDPPVEVIVTCRAQREGGLWRGDEADRLALLHQSAAFAPDFIDIEADVPRERWPAAPVILSHHDFDKCPDDLGQIVAGLEVSAAPVNKVAFAAAGPEHALAALDMIRSSAKPTMALAMGEAGLPSRILCRKFGAFGTFASLEAGRESAPGQPSIEQMKQLYRWDRIGLDTAVFGVIGCPIAHSMSPAIHNAAFEATGLDAVYLPLRIESQADCFNRFMDALLERPWLDCKGLSVTIPHKEHALAYVGPANCDPLARQIGAVNTITLRRENGAWTLRGDNTDYAAAVDALCQAMGIARADLAGQAVAVLGAGGAARAIVAALAHYQANVTIYNRTIARAEELAEEFGARAAHLDDTSDSDAQIIINCTPIGMHPHVDASPLEAIPAGAKVVFDTIYNPFETRLLTQARQAGCITVSGLEMFVNQAVAQFEIWTAQRAPREVMRQVVQDRLR